LEKNKNTIIYIFIH